LLIDNPILSDPLTPGPSEGLKKSPFGPAS
jgi:hypothetical protein